MVLEKLVANSAKAEQLITLLSQRLTSLQKACEFKRNQKEQHEIEKLTKENLALKQRVDNLKFDLECLRVQNGGKCVPLPKSKPTSLGASQPEPSLPTNKVPEKQKESKKAEKSEEIKETESVKDRKKGKEKEVGKKKDSKPKESAKSNEANPIDASRLDMRVGKIVGVQVHPDADTLYIEKVDLGEEKPRTIVSGLVKHLKPEDLQDRLAIFLCNLKPVKMRGVFSEGMIMCASSPEKVWPLIPPNGSVMGDRVRLYGYTVEPDALLNPKKKVWEQIKPDMFVNGEGKATYKGREFFIESKGACTSLVRNCPIT